MFRVGLASLCLIVFLLTATPADAQQYGQFNWQSQNGIGYTPYNSYYRVPRVYVPSPYYSPYYNAYRPSYNNYYYGYGNGYPVYGNTQILPAPQNDNRAPTGGSHYFGDPHASQYFPR